MCPVLASEFMHSCQDVPERDVHNCFGDCACWIECVILEWTVTIETGGTGVNVLSATKIELMLHVPSAHDLSESDWSCLD